MNFYKTTLLVCMATSCLTSCSFIPKYNRPNVDTAQSWSGEMADKDVSPRAQIAYDWWKSFGSDELNALMDQALTHNNDIKAAVYRIQQARSSVTVARSTLLPQASASGNLSRDRDIRGNNSFGDSDGYNAGVDISYELDLFGLNRAQLAGARANLLGSKFDADALALVVMGDVASTYFDLLGARERLRIADENLANSRDVLRIVNAQYEAGSTSGLEVAQQKSSLGSFEASRASALQEIKNYENALAVLIGRAPQTVTVEKNDFQNLQVPSIAAGQPSMLLTRRPDIALAESQLLAANADIGAARSAFFPNISLGVGLSAAASPISGPATAGLSTGASLLAPIFQGGRLLGNLGISQARQKELVENYRKTVLVSFQEVEDALAAERATADRETAYTTAVTQARKAFDISTARYKAGSIDFLTVLNSQVTLLQAQQNLSLARNGRLNASVQLFRALGGGWQSPVAAQGK